MARTPYKMKGFGGFGNQSPLRQDIPSVQDNTRTPKAREVKTKSKGFDSSRKGDVFGSYEDYVMLKKHFPKSDISYDDEFLKNFEEHN